MIYFILACYIRVFLMLNNDILKDITIVNKWFNKKTKENEYKIHHIQGFWSSNEGISISNTNLIKSDGLRVFIFDYDGYISPKEFQEKGTGWTLQNDDYIIKGKIEEINSISEIKEKYECMKITNIADKDYGSIDMRHFEISGE